MSHPPMGMVVSSTMAKRSALKFTFASGITSPSNSASTSSPKPSPSTSVKLASTVLPKLTKETKMSRFIKNRTWGCHKCRKQWLEDFYDIELHALGKLLCPQCKHPCCEDCAIEGLEDRLLSEPDLIDGLVDTEPEPTSQDESSPKQKPCSSSPNTSRKRKREQSLDNGSTQALNPTPKKTVKQYKKVATTPVKKQITALTEISSTLRRSGRARKLPITFATAKFHHEWRAKL